MKHQIVKNKGIKKKINAGFTLVEMIVVLTIMAIMMGGAVWGVTAWIAHYEYISSEEKAKTIYNAAQSALSAAESRGTLDEYMKSFEGVSDGIIKFAKNDGDAGLDKVTYGIPTDTDNEGEIHEYGYMVVKQGDYIAHPDKPLFEMLKTYVSDSEQLNASIVVEFDLTAKKVYSAFYSGWATSIQYNDSATCVERGDFYIKADNRKPEFREDYQVGYYSSDQVNVVKLDNLLQLKMEECALHNEETLFLTLKSSSKNAEVDTAFNISLLEDKDDKPLLCSFTISRKDIIGMYNNNDKNKPVLVDNIPVYDKDGKKINDFQFIVSFNQYENAEDGYYMSVVLDALSTEQSMAVLDNADEVTRLTNNAGYSITRLIGTDPKNILASVTAEPIDPTAYSASKSLESNMENSLYVTKEDTGEFAKYYDNEFAYLISRDRHLSNIRYVEDYNYDKTKEHQYILTKDLNFNDAVIYNGLDKNVNADFSYYSLTKDSDDFVFPTIPTLNEKSIFDGNGNQLTNLKINNKSSVAYEHGDDGKVISANQGSLPVNKAATIGLFGNNKGMIKRLIVSKAVGSVLSREEYDKTDGASGDDATRKAIYSDSIQAAGILCGRNEGDLREIYFDKDCKLEASVFANLDDTQEAKDNGIVTTDPEQRKNFNQRYGSGIGMAAGTVVLKKNASIDRIHTSGSVKGKITGKDTDYKEVPDVSAEAERKEIYNETPKSGETVSNAQYYSYGVGGVFGYVYGKYDTNTTRFGIGVDKDTITANNSLPVDNANSYIVMKKRGAAVTTEVLSADGGKKKVTSYGQTDTLLFASDETRSIVNKANVTGDDVSFIGGVVGNLYIAGLKANKVTEDDNNGSVKISDSAHPHMQNCYNYGDTTGNDFVGGVIGVNGDGGYIKDCESYGCPSASKGVSAGIASENFGFMKDCIVDRASADEDHDNKPYVPQINGNMLVAGAITSVNHEGCIVNDCDCSIADIDGVDDKIIITGNDIDTFGYLVGRNDGIVDNGRSGKHLGYKSNKTKLIIGGAVGTNSENAVVKNVEVTFDFVDEGQAECVGGIVGLNKGNVNNCKFGGCITKNKKSSAGMTIGGIVGKNGVNKNDDSDPTVNASIMNSYVIGAVIKAKGTANYNETSSEKQKLSSSSAVGGVCGINYQYSNIQKCYVTYLKKDDKNTQSSIEVTDGMVGGICAVNMGDINNCGYTDNSFIMNNGRLVVDGEKKTDMSLVNDAIKYLEKVSSDDKTIARPAVKGLNELFKNEETEEITASAEELLGTMPADENNNIYAFPKYDTDGTTLKYDVSANDYIISLNRGKGYVGGIAGYNTTSGKVKSCASGKWVVENYMPRVKYNAVGGVIGMNSADDKVADRTGNTGTSVEYNINFAYVRNELKDIPLNKLNNSGQVEDKENYDHNFYYVGGVIGTQNNVTNSDWTVEKCINVGTVLNYFGNNTGGVIALLKGNGGTVQYAYNYGKLMDGFTCSFKDTKGYSGTSGGIVAHYTDLQPDQVNNVLHCQNHGVIAFPMKGLNYDNCKIISLFGKMTSNDVGGIVGEISAPMSIDLYTVNIKDCVNGVDSRVYANSKSAGILGTIGCFAKDGNQISNTVNSIFVNIDTCRSYTSHLYSAQTRGKNSEFTRNGGAINSGRDKYAGGAPQTGYTTVRNCFGVRMYGYDNKTGYDMIDSKKPQDPTRGAISYFKSGDIGVNKATYRYCGNNYYMDEISFQYKDNDGWFGKTFGSVLENLGFTQKDNNHISYTNAMISYGNYETGIPLIENSNIDYCNEISRYYNDPNNLASERIVSATYTKDNGEVKYVLFKEPKGFNPNFYHKNNTYIDEDEKTVHIRRRKINTLLLSEETTSENVLYTFSEKGSLEPYNYKLLDHFYFDRIKKSKKYRDSESSNNSGVDLQAKVNGSRLPIADEYDINYTELDNCFVDYIEGTLSSQPDTIKKVTVSKSDTMGRYEVKWDVEPASGPAVSATAFDVRIRYIAVNTFKESEIDNYLKDNLVGEPEEKVAYGTTTTFIQPDKLITDSNMKYYAIVDVKDVRGKTEADYKDTARGYVELVPKLATPEVEIVAYGGEWMFHLKNADAYKDYANNSKTKNFKVHVYTLNGTKEDKTADILPKDLTFKTDATYNTQILSNAVSANAFVKETAGQEIFFVAKANNCMPSDKAMITAYVPEQCNPSGMLCELNPDSDGDHLKDKKPYFNGTLTYTKYGNDIHPAIPQLFRVELYGIKKDKDGNEVSHKTLAVKNVYLSEGETEDIKIGQSDNNSGAEFNYDEYRVERWYAGTGQGAYTYFETPSELADGKLRSAGFITDISEGTSGNNIKYYFYPVHLTQPEIEIVCMDRDPSWYARLRNPEKYEDTGAEIVCLEDEAFKIDTSNKLNGDLGTLLGYAGKMTPGTGSKTFVARKKGYLDSPAFTYSDSGASVNLTENLEDQLGVNYNLDGSLKLVEKEVEGKNVHAITYNGKLTYNSPDSLHGYYRYELYAYNKKNEAVTLHLSKEEQMDIGSGTHEKDIIFEVDVDDDGNNKYHDFHVAVWYADGDLNTDETKTEHRGFAQYIKLTEEQAKSSALGFYDEAKDSFVGARTKGLLIDISDGEGNYNYYYVAPLADKRYGDTQNYSNNVLYRENSETISSVQKITYNEESGVVSWEMNPTYYGELNGSDINCDVDIQIYQVDKSEGENPLVPTKDYLETLNVFDSYDPTLLAHGSIYIRPTTDKESDYDWNSYDYYALVRVKDKDANYQDAYCDPIVVKMVQPITLP